MSTKTTSISEFYNGATVFITGATGFLGKLLLEKLLRTCSDINCIYVLIRPKKGIDNKKRLSELLEGPVFKNLQANNPRSLEKIKVVCGDIGEENLGLDEADRTLLIDEVNIVLHSAATVSYRFTEDLDKAVMLNLRATKYMAELCKEAKQLKSFVYVSTAYVHPDKKEVEEIVYDPPCDPTTILKLIKTLPSNLLKRNTEQLMEKCRNTYLLTKALAESVVLEYSHYFPAAIVRPSIINPAWKEPFPGWVDNYGGATIIEVQCALGAFTHFMLKEDVVANFIPVDVVVDTIITTAWHSTLTSSKEVKVYNCVSSPTNSITWGKYSEFVQKYCREYPSQYLIRYPSSILISNRLMFNIYNHLFNFTPALCYDTFQYCIGKRPRMVNAWRKTTKHMEICTFASFQNREYHTTSFQSLLKAVREAEDGPNFNLDIGNENFDWDDYMKIFVLGIRENMLKENNSDLQPAKVRLNRIYWIGKLVQFTWFLGVFKIGTMLVKQLYTLIPPKPGF